MRTRLFAIGVVALMLVLAWLVHVRVRALEPGSILQPRAGDHDALREDVTSSSDGHRQRSDPEPDSVPARRSISLHVTDRTGAGVSGATVGSIRDAPAGLAPLGTTDSAGLLRLDPALACPARILVTSPGFVGAEIVWESIPETDKWIRLQAATVIRGRIVAGNDMHGVEGVRVLAWSDRLTIPGHEIAEQALQGMTSRGLSAVSNAEGWFELGEVSPSCTYSVVAGGRGWASFETACKVPPGESRLVIRVGALFGTVVRLVPTGVEADSLKCLAPPTLSPLQPDLPGATYLFQPSFVSVLAGLQAHLDSGSAMACTYLFACDSEAESIGPLPYKLSIPGFEPVDTTIQCPRALTELRETTIPLRSTAGERGHCSFRLRWPPGVAGSSGSILGGKGVIFITPLELGRDGRDASDVVLDLGLAAGQPCSIDLPLGSYRVRYLCIATGLSSPQSFEPARIVDVEPGEQAIEFDLSACGGILVQPIRPGGEHASGGFHVLLCKGGVPSVGTGAVMNSVFMSSAPYAIAPLNPGQYGIIPVGHSTMAPGDPATLFEVKAGEWTTVPVALQDP